jgi:FkbM family methyltransferase
MATFRKLRPRDINLEIGVGRESVERRFFVFEDGALNTFDAGLAKERLDAGRPLVGEYNIRTRPLREILHEHCRGSVDFLNIDAEGCDLEVLQSNDWNTHRPRVVCVEALQGDEEQADGWLMERGYTLVALTGRSRIHKLR